MAALLDVESELHEHVGDVLLDRYVVDAAILNCEKLGTVEIVALVCDGDRDGRIIRSFLHIGTNDA